jgi:hypothetical protein
VTVLARTAAGLLSADTRARHRLVARMLGDVSSVLDVGGVPGRLETYLGGAVVVTANLEGPADVVFDGRHLPFPERSFDGITSIDVLEHLPGHARGAHVDELRRVARRRIVLSTPFGSPAHIESERELADWYERLTGARHRFLDEHLAYGLADESWMRALAGQLSPEAHLFFHGDFRAVDARFRAAALARSRRSPLALARAARPLRESKPSPRPGPYTNRVFLIAEVDER